MCVIVGKVDIDYFFIFAENNRFSALAVV